MEATAFQTRATLESMKLDSSTELKHLKVDGGMTNGDVCMEILADIGGFDVVRPDMKEYVALARREDYTLTATDQPPWVRPFLLAQPSVYLVGTYQGQLHWSKSTPQAAELLIRRCPRRIGKEGGLHGCVPLRGQRVGTTALTTEIS